MPSYGFSGQMGIPTELSLSLFENTYYLESNPVNEIEGLYKNSEFYENIKVSSDNDFSIQLEDTPYLFKINNIINDSGITEVQIFGRTIEFNLKKNEMTIGNNRSPISMTSKKLDVTVIVDRCSIEIFADGGKIYMSCLDNDTFCDRNFPYFVIKSDNETVVEAMEIHSLNSIWE